MHLNVPTGSSFEFSVNDAAEMVLSATDLDLNSNTLSNVGTAGNDWTANFLRHQASAAAGSQWMLIENTSAAGGSDAAVQVKVNTAGADPWFGLTQSGGNEWRMGQDVSASDRMWIGTAGSTTNDALRITHATPPVISYNTTHPTGTFDYVCEGCGRHETEEFPCCAPVLWHDDVMDFRALVLRKPGAVEYMVRIGVMERTVNSVGEPETFTVLGPDWAFVGAMAYQNRQRMDAWHEEAEGRFASVEDRLAVVERVAKRD